MDKFWRQIVAAFLMGTLLPRLMLNVGSWMAPKEELPAESAPPQQQVTCAPTAPEQPWRLPVFVAQNKIVVMEIEEYVLGVVLAEMPATFEMEALKAQAVVARTYALRRFTLGDRHPDMAVCTDSQCCQAYMTEEEYLQYRGTQADVDKIYQAVQETKGQVLTYDGALAETTYFSCSGGRTEAAVAVWGTDIPYLQAVDSPGEEGAVAYWSSTYFSAADFARALGRELEGKPESWLGKRTFTDGAGVATMVIGGITYTGTQLRKLLGLNSTAFTMTADLGGITVEVLGRGHRVGMSQYGADAMAVSGSSYAEILTYYYQGTRIDKWENIG